MQKIVNVRIEPGYQLHLSFDDGASGTLDLRDWIEGGGVFEQLRDPAAFARVHIGGGGRFLEWPNEIDVCADALRERLDAISATR
jgi:hypothetical protein